MYLLDTDWLIQTRNNRQPALQVVQRLAGGRICVSYISAGELYEGAFNSVAPGVHLFHFRWFLSAFHLLPVTDDIMERFAELRAYLRRQGQLISDFDLVIAATALLYDLTLLTFNLRHFQRIPDLRLYQPG